MAESPVLKFVSGLITDVKMKLWVARFLYLRLPDFARFTARPARSDS